MPRSKPKRSSRKKPQKYEIHDSLWDESPRVQKMKEQVRIQTQKETETKVLRQALVSVIRVRFPDLTKFAQQQVELFDKPDALDLLIQQVAKAPDANTVHWLLDSNTGNA